VTDISGVQRPSWRRLGCLLGQVAGDEAALTEALAWREVTGARLTVLICLPTPRYVAFPDGGIWWDDLLELEALMQAWLEERTAGLSVDQHVVLPDSSGPAACDWARREGLGMLIVARGASRLGRLLHGDPAAYLIQHAPCPVLVVAGVTAQASRNPARGSRLAVRC
jgi:nucleotide-binding universal stress UspA family protein